MTDLVRTFAALSDATRFAIVERLLADGELPAGELVAEAGLTAPAVSRHLKVLRDAGVLRQRVDGTRRLYSVEPEALGAISRWTMTHREFWEGALTRLEAALAAEAEADPEAEDDDAPPREERPTARGGRSKRRKE